MEWNVRPVFGIILPGTSGMSSPPSAVITDHGRRTLLRIHGRYQELSQEELRTLLGIPSGPPELGITVERDRLCFVFAADDQVVELTAGQLNRLLAKPATTKA